MYVKYNRTKEPASFKAPTSYGNAGHKTSVSAYALLTKPQTLSLHSYLRTARSSPLKLFTRRKQWLALQTLRYNNHKR